MKRRCFYCGASFNGTGNQLFCCPSHRKKYNQGYLVLTLKKQWFDMILSGEKKEEYRAMKPYWEKRFLNYFGKHYDFSNEQPKVVWNSQEKMIVFRNGYGNDKPEFKAECVISEGYGKEEWGAVPGEKYYVLKILRVFGERNMKE